jgi:uncharacterized membrane protein YebE (DUF533 family)
MLATRNADEQALGALAQQAIQCYTQNQIASAAQATRGNARAQDMCGKRVERGIAGRQTFQDHSGFCTVMVQI